MKRFLFFLVSVLAGSHCALAQQTVVSKDALKARMTASICDCLTRRSAAKKPDEMTRVQAKQVVAECFGSTAGKEMKVIQAAYGREAFSNSAVMHTIGEEIGAQLVQSCPGSIGYFMAMSGQEDKSADPAATTGQTTGQLGGLSGPGVTLLEVQLSKTEKAYFAWLRHFDQADELLRKLSDLQGHKVRVTWQEVEVLQPDTRHYQRVREITGIELL